jgi:hypothetical protein
VTRQRGCTSWCPFSRPPLLVWVFWKNVETLRPFNPKNAFDYSPLIVMIGSSGS